MFTAGVSHSCLSTLTWYSRRSHRSSTLASLARTHGGRIPRSSSVLSRCTVSGSPMLSSFTGLARRHAPSTESYESFAIADPSRPRHRDLRDPPRRLRLRASTPTKRPRGCCAHPRRGMVQHAAQVRVRARRGERRHDGDYGRQRCQAVWLVSVLLFDFIVSALGLSCIRYPAMYRVAERQRTGEGGWGDDG